jgi:hypothetical protein
MFTFKTEKASGRYAFLNTDHHYIKLKRKEVGQIGDEPPHVIRFMVKKKDINEDNNPNCEWKWIKLKRESKSVEDAKQFLRLFYKEIIEKYELYPLSD